MKSILLTIALSASTFFGMLALLDKHEAAIPEYRLPAVEITAPKTQPQLQPQPQPANMLPTVIIRAKRLRITTAFKIKEVMTAA
ncbi:MAG: hypothetical protein R2791_06805 [Saprospiraceae bacterium]